MASVTHFISTLLEGGNGLCDCLGCIQSSFFDGKNVKPKKTVKLWHVQMDSSRGQMEIGHDKNTQDGAIAQTKRRIHVATIMCYYRIQIIENKDDGIHLL